MPQRVGEPRMTTVNTSAMRLARSWRSRLLLRRAKHLTRSVCRLRNDLWVPGASREFTMPAAVRGNENPAFYLELASYAHMHAAGLEAQLLG